MSARHVALLRAINVGGRNKLPMRELVAIFEELGCTDVRTYVQSGNVVFGAPAALARKLPAQLPAAIARRAGFTVPVLTRTAAAFLDIARAHPFAADGVAPKELHVAFLGAAPAARVVAALDPSRSPADRWVARGDVLYLHLPGGVGGTRLSNDWLEKQLGTTSTWRNWNTVEALAKMLAE